MLERVAAFDGDSTMINTLLSDDAAGVFAVFADGDLAAAFEDFAGGVFLAGDFDDDDSSGFTALALFDGAFVFLASSVFDEAAFLKGEIWITPIYIF